MGIDRPNAWSTPTVVCRVSGRKGVHEDSSRESPIPNLEKDNQWYCPSNLSYQEPPLLNHSPKQARNKESTSPDNSSNDSDCQTDVDASDEDSLQISSNPGHSTSSNLLDPQQNSSHMKTTPYKKKTQNYAISTLSIVCFVVLIYVISKGNSEPNRTNPEKLIDRFKRMERQFTNQEEDFWRKIRLNIEEIRKMHKPSTIIFLYENSPKSESTMQRILNDVKVVAVCHLTDCDKDAIKIQGSSLNVMEIIADYGKVISQFKDPLRKSGVMIVEHLEEVPGKVAQAFHHFCDEYDPLVSNALLLFTVKVDKLPDDEQSDSYLRKTLTLLWNDIGRDDKFEPLYARISETILVVRPE